MSATRTCASRRLAVKTGGQVWVYDTLDHHIGGFSQQQGLGGSITFTSQHGTVNLSTLPVVSRDGVPQAPAAVPQPVVQEPSLSTPPVGVDVNQVPRPETLNHNAPTQPTDKLVTSEEVIATLERLGNLLEKGYLTEDEFATKKAELLSRL